MIIPLVLLACSTPSHQPGPEAGPPAAPGRAEPQAIAAPDRGPVIERIAILPALPTADADLTVAIEVRDPDGDPVEVDPQWWVDDRPLPRERGRTLARGRFRKGDVVQVAVEASDGQLTTLGRSPRVRIRNSPPSILNRTRDLERLDGYRIRAEDPDGDVLSFQLDDAPPGLSIDPASGFLRWRGSETQGAGTYRVGIRVQDPDGAFARWTFGLALEAGSGVASPEPVEPVVESLPEDTAAEPLPPRGASPVEAFEPSSRW